MKQKNYHILIKKIILFVAGLLILSLGIAFSAVSGLGISPLNCLAYVLGETSGVQMGYMTMVLYIIYVLIEIPIKGKEFRIFDLLQIPVAILFGFFVNWTRSGLAVVVCTNYIQRLLCCLISIVMIAAGTTIYVVPHLTYQAPEGLIMAICGRWDKKFGTVKTCFDVAVVAAAVLVGLLFNGTVIGIREGTLFAAFGVGMVVNVFHRTLLPWAERWMNS